jgi:AraC-like DNA-binding protein
MHPVGAPSRAATSVELLVALGAEHGVDARRLLDAAGTDGATLARPDAEVSAAQELAVVTALIAASGDPPGLGLVAGQRYQLTSYGIWGFALSSSPTLRVAIDVGLRHLGLTYALTSIDVVIVGDTVHVRFDADHLPAVVRRFLVERDAAAVAVVADELLGGADVPLELRLRSEGDEEEGRATVARARVRRGAAHDELTFPAAWLDRPLPRADPRTAALAAAQCTELLAARRSRVGVAGEVRERLTRHVADPPSMTEVAAERYVTERTLRRQLATEGTSFRALLDEVRVTVACELLTGTGLSVTETARRVGFGEPASFVHAFRRWTGSAPGAYRDRLRTPRAVGASGRSDRPGRRHRVG